MTIMEFSTRPLVSLIARPAVAMPETNRLLPSSPARALMTDFTLIQPQIIKADTPIDEAHLRMRYGGFRLLLVVDDRQHCIWVITAREVIGGRRITQVMQQRGITREDVTVIMVQTFCHKLLAMLLEQLVSPTIDDLVRALATFGEQHLLVTDRIEAQQQRIREIISASDIERSLGSVPADLPEARRSDAHLHTAIEPAKRQKGARRPVSTLLVLGKVGVGSLMIRFLKHHHLQKAMGSLCL